MTRRTWFFLGMSGLVGCARNQRRLNVFNWSAYVAPETIPNFEREFGVHVRYSVYESNEEMLARVMTGNSGWDVVFPTNYLIEPMRESGLLAPLDHSRLPNLGNLDPLFQKPSWDPALEWGMPYMWNATGIVYNRKLAPPIQGWSNLWDKALSGKITMLDDPVDVFAACLKKIGKSINSRSEEDLRAAQQQAMQQKPLLRAYLNAEARDQVVSGDIAAAQMWSTTAQQAMDASKDLAFAYPQEGFAVYPDCAVILKESARGELAHQFLNYLLRPEVAASIVKAVKTATANGAGRALLPPDLRESQTLYPSADIMQRGEWSQASSPQIQRLRDRLWTEVKSS